MRCRLQERVLAIDSNGTLQHLPPGTVLQILDQGSDLVTVRSEGKTFRSFWSDLQQRGEWHDVAVADQSTLQGPPELWDGSHND